MTPRKTTASKKRTVGKKLFKSPVGRNKGGKIAVTADTQASWYEEEYVWDDMEAISNRRDILFEEKFKDRGIIPASRIDLNLMKATPELEDFMAKIKFQGWDKLFCEKIRWNDDQVLRFMANLHVSSLDPPIISSYVDGQKIRDIDPASLAKTLGIKHNDSWIRAGYPLTPSQTKELKKLVINSASQSVNWGRTSHLTPLALKFSTWCRKLITPKAGDSGGVPIHMLHFIYALLSKKHIQFTTFILEEWIRTFHSNQKNVVFPHFISKILLEHKIETSIPFFENDPYKVKVDKGKRTEDEEEEGEEDFEGDEGDTESEKDQEEEEKEAAGEINTDEFTMENAKIEFKRVHKRLRTVAKSARRAVAIVNDLQEQFVLQSRSNDQQNQAFQERVFAYFDLVTPDWRKKVAASSSATTPTAANLAGNLDSTSTSSEDEDQA